MSARPPRPAVTRRPRGTGYVTPIWQSDAWRYRARFPVGGSREQNVGTYSSEAEAERVLNACVEARKDLPACGSVSIYDFGKRWIAGLRDKNKRTWQSTWATVVKSATFADCAIDTVRRQEIREWAHGPLLVHASARTGKPISRQTAKHALGLVRRALAAAFEEGAITSNPAAGLALPRSDEPASEAWTYLSEVEIDQLLTLPELPGKQRAAFAVAIYAGLRQGEIAALRWENVDLRQDRPRLHVVGSWDGATKTARARRVPLLPAAVAALSAWRSERGRPSRGLVFPSSKGSQHARGYDFGWAEMRDRKGQRFDGYRARAGIDRPVRFHDLRHTCASHLVSGTWGRAWTLREVAEMLGHSSVSTAERYAHLAQGALDRAAAATTIRPESVRADHQLEAQVRELIRRAVRESNARPSAPEYAGIAHLRAESEAADGLRTDLRTVALQIAAGESIDRGNGDAFARAVMAAAVDLAAVAGRVLSAPDERWHAALLTLLERVAEHAQRQTMSAKDGAG